MLHKVTVMPGATEVWLSANDPLTHIEYESGGETLIPFGCRAGACGACVVEILNGRDALGQRNNEETRFLGELGFEGEQFRLACQCRVLGEVTIRPVAEG